MRRVLVTGGAGFIGKAVRAELEQRGDVFVPFDHGHDVCDYEDVLNEAEDCQAIMNLAAVLGTVETFGTEHDVARVNVLGAITVADVAAELGVPMVQVGTGHKGQPNPYAITKACAEDLLLARAQWCGQPINVVRAISSTWIRSTNWRPDPYTSTGMPVNARQMNDGPILRTFASPCGGHTF